MSGTDVLILVLAGLGAGLTGSVAGLASLVSYPALLATGLPPLAANVTNTTALLATGVGSAAGSRIELRGQWPRLRVLVLLSAVGGGIGAALLLTTDESTFEAVVPWLVGLGAVLLLARDRIRVWAVARRARPGARRVRAWQGHLLVMVVGVYGGYFGAGVGIILLALLAAQTVEPLAVTNAVKNIASASSNVVAAIAYAFLAPVHWPAVVALSCGAVAGSWLGPQVVRVLPERPLRYAIGVAGLGLAAYLLTT